MDSARINDWAQVLGLFGIVGSLIFVGLEVQQSRQIAVADVYQQRSALAMQLQTSVLANEPLLVAFGKGISGEPLTGLEERYLYFNNTPWLTYWENIHFQYEIGLLSEEQWLASRESIRTWTDWHDSLDYWANSRSQWRESFAEAIDEIIEEEASR